jgi:hypothetical protein
MHANCDLHNAALDVAFFEALLLAFFGAIVRAGCV